jgi:hypothetical protein
MGTDPHALDVGRNELLILDPMFNARIPRSSLLAENYSEWFNIPSHDMSADEVDEALGSFLNGGLVTVNTANGRGWYGLTPKGGAMWEAQRQPDWSSYCVASTAPSTGDISSLQITAVSRAVGEQYLKLAVECGIYLGIVADGTLWSPCASPIYWKPGLSAWTTELQVREGDDSFQRNVRRFRMERRWWSEIGDITYRGTKNEGNGSS